MRMPTWNLRMGIQVWNLRMGMLIWNLQHHNTGRKISEWKCRNENMVNGKRQSGDLDQILRLPFKIVYS